MSQSYYSKAQEAINGMSTKHTEAIGLLQRALGALSAEEGKYPAYAKEQLIETITVYLNNEFGITPKM